MPAARTAIFDRIITVLQSASSIAGSRVYKGRHNVLPTAATDFPVVYTYTLREEVETLTMGSSSRHQTRVLIGAVDYLAKAATAKLLEEGFDTACGLIEAAISADTDLNGTCQDIVLTSTEYLYDGSEDVPFGRAALQYRITYFADEP
jgi:hypothetical protein